MPTRAELLAAERASLAQTAVETGERLARQETLAEQHAQHLAVINGSISDLAKLMSTQGSDISVMAVSIGNIEKAMEAGLRAGDRRAGRLTQWHLAGVAIAAGLVTGFLAFLGSVLVALLVLWANGKLG